VPDAPVIEIVPPRAKYATRPAAVGCTIGTVYAAAGPPRSGVFEDFRKRDQEAPSGVLDRGLDERP